jgi:T5SS/PEP-CTERM-associated repeat protein
MRRISLLVLLLAHYVQSAESFWINSSSGLFGEAANWAGGVPGPLDTASFSNAGLYGVSFLSDAMVNSARFYRGVVTQDIGNVIWSVTNSWRVGEEVGQMARVLQKSGTLSVTNAGGTAVLEVGRVDTGELELRGGEVVSDVLRATNGTRSKLTFASGTLTTLGGSSIALNGRFLIGQDPTKVAIWNTLGGSNTVITPFYEYGGITMGNQISLARGRAVLNIQGSGTVLSVPGLDVSQSSSKEGSHVIQITDGAQFKTKHVQLGVGDSTSNSVLISGTGSAWVNEDHMYFGMHAGGQSLIITNGALFQTGAPNYSDQKFHLGNTNARVIITGPNSRFRSEGTMSYGERWCYPRCDLNNLILITNGGFFHARQLSYGAFFPDSTPSGYGSLILVENGTLSIGLLDMAVGSIRVVNGTGTIDQLFLRGGTNALLEASPS